MDIGRRKFIRNLAILGAATVAGGGIISLLTSNQSGQQGPAFPPDLGQIIEAEIKLAPYQIQALVQRANKAELAADVYNGVDWIFEKFKVGVQKTINLPSNTSVISCTIRPATSGFPPRVTYSAYPYDPTQPSELHFKGSQTDLELVFKPGTQDEINYKIYEYEDITKSNFSNLVKEDKAAPIPIAGGTKYAISISALNPKKAYELDLGERSSVKPPLASVSFIPSAFS